MLDCAMIGEASDRARESAWRRVYSYLLLPEARESAASAIACCSNRTGPGRPMRPGPSTCEEPARPWVPAGTTGVGAPLKLQRRTYAE
jgi:hypothetical protein